MRLLIDWVADIYQQYGWRAALIVVAVLASIGAGIVIALHITPLDFVTWLNSL